MREPLYILFFFLGTLTGWYFQHEINHEIYRIKDAFGLIEPAPC